MVYLNGVVAPKLYFSPIFGNVVVTLTFYLWASNFQKDNVLDTTLTSFFINDKSSCLVYLNGVMAPNLNFCPCLVMW